MLTPIPWQPNLWVHVDLLAKLEEIRARLGRDPMLYGSRSAWRSHAQQAALYDDYKTGRGPIASNPNTGNRTHMRGVAADFRDTSTAMARACGAVGLQRDPAERWHWQLTNWRAYPIITELPDPTEDEDNMAQGAFYRNKDTGAIFWQERPNTVLVPIDLPTWLAYSANGNKFLDLIPAEIDGLRAKWGEAPAPATPHSTTGASAEQVADELAERLRE